LEDFDLTRVLPVPDLRGTAVELMDPFEAVDSNDWMAARDRAGHAH